MTTNPATPNTPREPVSQHPDEASQDAKTQKHQGGGLEPSDSRIVTGTAVTEDGRWTGAAVKPQDGPRVPKPKD